MIRVELGEEVNRRGRFRWTCPRYALRGVSRAPLLDACREIGRMGGRVPPRYWAYSGDGARSVPDCRLAALDGAPNHTVDVGEEPRLEVQAIRRKTGRRKGGH